jgi:hypothetical protein
MKKMKKKTFSILAVMLLVVSCVSMQSEANNRLTQLRAENPDAYIGQDSDGVFKIRFYSNGTYKVLGWWKPNGAWVDLSENDISGTYNLDGNTAVMRNPPTGKGRIPSLLERGVRLELYETVLTAIKTAANEYIYIPTKYIGYTHSDNRVGNLDIFMENGVQGIRITYPQLFEVYHVMGGKEGEKEEQVIPDDGTEIVFSLGITSRSGYFDGEYKTINPPRVATPIKDGKVMFSGDLQEEILASIQDVEELKKSSIRILVNERSANLQNASLQGNPYVHIDFTTIDFVQVKIAEFTELIKTVPKNSINTLVALETFAEAIISLKAQAQYPFQLGLLRQEITKARNELYEKIEAEKKLITDAIPEFFIQGEITDSSDFGNAIVYQIWGTAQPIELSSGNRNVMGAEGFRTQNSNLWVVIKKNIEMKADAIQRFASTIKIFGGVYYTSRDYGENSYGQQVPIFNYSNDMTQVPNVGNRKQQLDTYNTQLATISEVGKRYLAELD